MLGYPGRRAAVLVRGRVRHADRLFGRAVPEGGGRGQSRARRFRELARRMGSGHCGRSLSRPSSRARSTCCAAPTPSTLERRKEVSFSIPIFPGGIAAMLRSDAPRAAAGCPRRPAAVRPDLARLAGADPRGQDLLGRNRHDRARPGSRSRLNDFQLTRQGRSGGQATMPARCRCWTARPTCSSATGRSLLEAAAAKPIGRRPDRARQAVHLRADRPDAGAGTTTIFGWSSIDPSAGNSRPRSSGTSIRKWFGAPDDAVLAFFRQSAMPE